MKTYYKIVTSYNSSDMNFEKQVQDFLDDGWELAGGLSFVLDNSLEQQGCFHSQALYKKTEMDIGR